MQTDAPASAAPESTPTVEATPGSYIFLTVLAGISLAADLVTKAWAHAKLSGFDPQKLSPKKITIIKDHVDFIYALNPGGAWSFLRSLPDSLRRPFFLFVSASAIVFIVSIYRRVPRAHAAMRWGLPLALGGAVGNLVDRIRYGQVIDFIDMYFIRKGREVHWPTYNVADIAIVVGVGLMVLDMLIPARRARPDAQEAPAVDPPVEGEGAGEALLGAGAVADAAVVAGAGAGAGALVVVDDEASESLLETSEQAPEEAAEPPALGEPEASDDGTQGEGSTTPEGEAPPAQRKAFAGSDELS